MKHVLPTEHYTPGYSAAAVEFMARRSAERQAKFLLPHLKPGLRLLDIGCGSGTITEGLARAVAPGRVIGLDPAHQQMEAVRRKSRRAHLPNLTYQPGSVYELSFSENSFDVVFAHGLFEHLKRPESALREISRVLKPGGLAALRSPDWGGFLVHPLSPTLRQALAYYQKIQRRNGGDVHAGRKLKDWARRAGFENLRWSGSFEFVDELGPITEYLAAQLEQRPPAARQGGTIPPLRLKQYVRALSGLAHEPGALFAGSWGELLAVKARE